MGVFVNLKNNNNVAFSVQCFVCVNIVINLFGKSLFSEVVLHNDHSPIFTVCGYVRVPDTELLFFSIFILFFCDCRFFSSLYLFFFFFCAVESYGLTCSFHSICCLIIDVNCSLFLLLMNFSIFFYSAVGFFYFNQMT